MPDAMDADRVIRELGLVPHPEGGHYREVFRDSVIIESRGSERHASTAIYYLLCAGEISHWHRVDAAEVWHWYAGAPLVLTLYDDNWAEDGREATSQTLGNDLSMGQRPQIVVPAEVWQTARSLGDWTLAGCTVAPAFRFEGFEMAPPDWYPHPRFARRDKRV